MDIRKVKKLIELLEESNVAELEIKEGEETVRISRNYPQNMQHQQYYVQQPNYAQQPMHMAAPAAAAPAEAAKPAHKGETAPLTFLALSLINLSLSASSCLRPSATNLTLASTTA